MSETDRAWFKQHPETNYRVRRPCPGEVDQIVLRMHPNAAGELQQLRSYATVVTDAGEELTRSDGNNLPCLIPGHQWQVLVIKLPGQHVVRLLTVEGWTQADGAPGIDPAVGVAAFMVGGRLAVEKMKV